MDATNLVRYEMTKEDYISFNLYHQKHSPSMRAQRRKAMFIMGVAGLVLAGIPLLYPRTRVLWAGSAVFLLSACVMPSSHEKAVRKIVDKMLDEGRNKGMLGLKEIAINPVEICSTGALRSLTVRWPAVEKVVVTDQALYVYISAIEAIIVPVRAFERLEEFDAFRDAVLKYQAEAALRSK